MSEIISQYGMIFLVMACLFGFFMAWGVGANDVANAMGTSVGAKAITIKQAILIAIVFEFAGAYLAGGDVTSTIRSGIIDIQKAGFSDSPELLVYGMLSSLLAAGIWLLIASNYGWPVSTTHSIIGAIVGFAVVGISPDAVVWSQVGSIVSVRKALPTRLDMARTLARSACPFLCFETALPRAAAPHES